MKYNLTIWQQLTLPFVWAMWSLADPTKRKTWHEVKKGMEPHTCIFTKRFEIEGYVFFECEHEGCNLCSDVRSLKP